MRRRRIALVTAAAVAFVVTPGADAADFSVVPGLLSGSREVLRVTVTLPRAERVGVRVLDGSGRALGWVAAPQERRYLRLRWDGSVGAQPLPDGRYRIELVGPKTRRLGLRRIRLDRTAPQLVGLRAYTRSNRPFQGDRRLLATISPNGDGLRDAAKVGFTLTERARVELHVTRTRSKPETIQVKTATLGPGPHTFTWFPPRTIAPRTYLIRVVATDTAGNRRSYGATNAESGRRPTGPVIRVLGVEAAFGRDRYVPGAIARLSVETDAQRLTLQPFRAGTETVPTYSDTTMNGTPVGDELTLAWTRRRDGPATIRYPVGDWPSGLYYVRLTTDDGRVGFAPFVVHPPTLGTTRVAVVLPTFTWQSYNFRDEDGNGWGDTWYAKGAQSTVRLHRPFLKRGVPPQYRKHELGFLRWLAQTGKTVEMLTESDVEAVGSGEALAALYDLVVYAGHSEYVTRLEYDVVERYRDLGGNLMFLSANNFFWEVRRRGNVLTRTRKWRELGRPEAALLGVQYRANDDGRRQRPFLVRNIDAVPWLYAGTGLVDGAPFGQELGGYGIEIDTTTESSPPGTIVVAEIPELYGPGFTAQMTYYETPAGAKVFSAGALDFGGTALLPAIARMLENLWVRLAAP
jgi:hypothetical protein